MANEINQSSKTTCDGEPSGEFPVISAPSVNGATPVDGDKTLYQGQKIALSVSTSNLKSNNYDSIKFEIAWSDDFSSLDKLKAGLIVHPDSVANTTQSITTADTYDLDVVVFGQWSTTNFGFCRWNVDVTGPGLPDLSLNGNHLGAESTDYGYGTSTISAGNLYAIKLIPGNTTTFNEAASIKVSGYQINDASGNAITTAQFSACVVAKNGNLDNFDFWDKNHAKLNKIRVGGHDTYVWIDSDTNGSFTFYVSSNLASGMYSDTLTMLIGNEDPVIAQVIVGTPEKGHGSSLLRAPVPDDAEGDTLLLKSTDYFVVASVPRPPVPNAIQSGDVLIPIVNNKLQLNSFFIANGNGIPNGFPDCFSIPVAAFTVGADNVLKYMTVRQNQVGFSSEATYQVTGTGNSGNIPPYPQMPLYEAPIIVGNEACLAIDFDMVENGLTVKIQWLGGGWAPVSGDVLKLIIVFNGWNAGGAVHAAQTVPFPPIDSTDLTNGYAQFVVGYQYFAGWVPNGRDQSTVFLQYQVPNDGTNAPGYSTATKTMNIDTVPPGGV